MAAGIVNALQQERFSWVSNVPLSAIAVLRAEEKLEYMRGILRKGITDLKARNDKDLINVGDQIENNLKEAFGRQEAEISTLQIQVNRILKKEIPIITGGFLAGMIPLVDKAVSVLFAGRDIKKALAERAALKRDLRVKESEFINLLFKSYDRKS